MPEQARVSDIGHVPSCAHGCPGCAHDCQGPITGGSPDVFVNDLPAARVDDPGVHASCCGSDTYVCKSGSGTVFINGKKAHRKDDDTLHCGGDGTMTTGSGNVFTGG